MDLDLTINGFQPLGCKACQGYLFGRPLPLEQFEAELLNR